MATVLGPTPWRCSRSRTVGGNSATSSRWYSASPVSAISRIRAARSLPMPGISRSPASSSFESSCGWLLTMSAPLRYARILNGLSSLISSRSAISRRMRAMATLSNPQAFAFDAVVEEGRAAGRERGCNCLAGGRRTVAEQAAAAARAAHFRGGRAGGARPRNQALDRRRRDTRREPLAVFPLRRNLSTDFFPVTGGERAAHRDRGIADAFEGVEHLAIAVDVLLGDLPVVRPRVAGRAGVGEHDAALELARIDVESEPLDAVDAQLDGGDATVQRGPVILDPGRDLDRLALHVHGGEQQVFRIGGRVRPPGQ